jgi:hypothetical protein
MDTCSTAFQLPLLLLSNAVSSVLRLVKIPVTSMVSAETLRATEMSFFKTCHHATAFILNQHQGVHAPYVYRSYFGTIEGCMVE